MQKKFFTTADLANYLNVSQWTIYSWIHQQKIPKVPGLGRMIRFDPEVIEAWLKSGGVDAGQQNNKQR